MKRFQLQSVRSCQIYNFDIKIVFIRDRMKIVFIENDYQERANCYLTPFAACGTPTNHFFCSSGSRVRRFLFISIRQCYINIYSCQSKIPASLRATVQIKVET
jgi:hypothetical protein